MNSLYWLYVYYKTPVIEATQQADAAETIVNHVADALGIQAKLLRRPQAVDGCITWMEVYGPLPERMLQELNDTLAGVRTSLVASKNKPHINWQGIELHTELFLENGVMNAYA
jgi:hypothetical protein